MRLEEAITHNSQCKKCGKCCYLKIGGFGVIIETNTRCKHLTDNNLCAVYRNRPSWCLSAKQMNKMDILPQSCGYRGGV